DEVLPELIDRYPRRVPLPLLCHCPLLTFPGAHEGGGQPLAIAGPGRPPVIPTSSSLRPGPGGPATASKQPPSSPVRTVQQCQAVRVTARPRRGERPAGWRVPLRSACERFHARLHLAADPVKDGCRSRAAARYSAMPGGGSPSRALHFSGCGGFPRCSSTCATLDCRT